MEEVAEVGKETSEEISTRTEYVGVSGKSVPAKMDPKLDRKGGKKTMGTKENLVT